MPNSGDGVILLLKGSCQLIREVADFFAGDDGRAQRARKTLERRQRDPAKGKISAAFYANISVDLAALDETLQGIADTWSDGQGPGVRAASQVLDVLEDAFLNKEELIKPDDSEDEDEPDVQVDGEDSRSGDMYVLLQAFVAKSKIEFGTEPGNAESTERIERLLEMTKFSTPKGKSRDLLLQSVKECNDVLKPMSSGSVDISYQANRSADLEWAEVGEAFRFVERLHDTLEHWNCDCFTAMSHRHAKFAFDLGPAGRYGSVAGTMFYPSLDPFNDKRIWRRAHLEFQDDIVSPTLRSPTHKSAFTDDDRASKLSALCGVLEDIAVRGEGAFKLTAGEPKLCDVPTHANVFQDLSATSDSSFVDCYDLPQPQRLLNMSSKRRISVALVLAYAYLHLGGGSWWPYTKRPNLHSQDIDNEGMPPSRLVLFSPDFSRQNEELPYVLTAFNADMPSLPAFGKLLLELFVGKSVKWDELNSKMETAKDESLGTEMLQAVSTCLATGTDKTFKGGGTIREDERLRTHFVKGVVIPIQYVLRIGYNLKPQDIFKTVSTSGVVEIKERPARRLPIRRDRDGPETIGDGFCLHDGQDGLEKAFDTHCKSADKYISELKTSSRKFLRTEGKLRNKINPVRIAILDTGAHIPADEAEHVYNGRIKECRTWLRSTKDSGEALAGPCSDRDGHGTHGTSVLLQATENTKIEVFVAQIFDRSTEKVKQDSIIDDQTVRRIANALRYAVDHWNVDIISMSFGFPEVIPEIDKAIQHARRKNVLMLAAASNYGGNRKRTWPARSDDVMCIYATDGDGNKYGKNPTPLANKDNFAVLGESVEALWPPTSPHGRARKARKSGTSTATPICAAIAGIIVTALRLNEDDYVSSIEEGKREETRQLYRQKVTALGRASAMASVFELMVNKEGMRDDYHFIAPWRIFDEGNHKRSTTLENILDQIDA